MVFPKFTGQFNKRSYSAFLNPYISVRIKTKRCFNRRYPTGERNASTGIVRFSYSGAPVRFFAGGQFDFRFVIYLRYFRMRYKFVHSYFVYTLSINITCRLDSRTGVRFLLSDGCLDIIPFVFTIRLCCPHNRTTAMFSHRFLQYRFFFKFRPFVVQSTDYRFSNGNRRVHTPVLM